MNKDKPAHDPLRSRLKHLIAGLFRVNLTDPDEMSDDTPLNGGELDLDSLDELELALGVEEEFGVPLSHREEFRRAFASIGHLAEYIQAHRPGAPVQAGAVSPQPSPIFILQPSH